MKRWNWRGWWARHKERTRKAEGHPPGECQQRPAAAAAWSPIARPAAPLMERSSRAATPCIQVRCFGGFAVEYAGRLLGSRERALEWQILAYLAVHPADGVARAELVQAVWGGGVPTDSSRINAALCRLRRLLQDQAPGLCSTVVTSHRDGRVCLDSACIRSDAQEAWRVIATATRLSPAERRRAVARLRTLTAPPLLEGCRWPWLRQRDAHGRTLEQRLVMRLDALAQLGDGDALEPRLPRMAPSRAGRRRPAPLPSVSPFPC